MCFRRDTFFRHFVGDFAGPLLSRFCLSDTFVGPLWMFVGHVVVGKPWVLVGAIKLPRIGAIRRNPERCRQWEQPGESWTLIGAARSDSEPVGANVVANQIRPMSNTVRRSAPRGRAATSGQAAGNSEQELHEFPIQDHVLSTSLSAEVAL